MPPKSETSRPWFTSPLLPILLSMAGITLLLLDGLTPYRTYLRRKRWTRVKGRLASSVERRAKVRSSARGSTRLEYLARRAQRRTFPKVVTRGWPLSQKKRVWIVRVTYTYPWKGKRFTRVADTPGTEFPTRREARAYLAKHIQKGSIRVWVNPKDPQEATAFLDPPYTHTLLLGLAIFALGVLWLIAALILRRAHVRQEGV